MVKMILIAIVIGIIFGFIVAGIMKSGLTSVHTKTEAADYLTQGSLKMEVSTEKFVRKQTDKREKPKN